ncbi:hypothetical protein FRC02_005137, partial [Tulasnella sp. 418]
MMQDLAKEPDDFFKTHAQLIITISKVIDRMMDMYMYIVVLRILLAITIRLRHIMFRRRPIRALAATVAPRGLIANRIL